MKQTIIVEFDTEKQDPELLDKITGRIYTLDGVKKSGIIARFVQAQRKEVLVLEEQ